MEEDEELSNTLLNPLNNRRPTKGTIMEPVEEGISDIHEPEAQTQDVSYGLVHQEAYTS